MSEYPTLSEMDINRCEEITRYSLRQDGKSRDILKIYYKRKKGSVLPERKTFKFGRSAKMVADDSAVNGSIEIFEISPFLLKAIAELDTIVDQHESDKDKIKLMIKRVEQLEHDVSFATHELKILLKSLDNK